MATSRYRDFAMARPRSPRGRARETIRRLAEEYPGTARELCALNHANAYELLVATILSAQCTDEMVNKVTPAVFARYPTPDALASAEAGELEAIVKPTGFYRNKTKSLIGMAQAIVGRYDGEVPSAMEELTTPGTVARRQM